MPRPGYRKNQDVIALVRRCVSQRFTYEESIAYLKKHGFEISDKTFQRIKKDLGNSRKDRINNIVNEEYANFTLDSIDLFDSIEEKLLDIANTTKDEWKKIKALEEIRKTRREAAEFFESSPVIQIMDKKFGDKKNDLEKSD